VGGAVPVEASDVDDDEPFDALVAAAQCLGERGVFLRVEHLRLPEQLEAFAVRVVDSSTGVALQTSP